MSSTACGFATVRMATDRSARATRSPVSLLLVDPPVLDATRAADVHVYLFAVDEAGAPRRTGTPTFSPGVGTVSGIETVARGVWRGRWRVPAGEASAVGVEAAFGPEPGVGASLARSPGDPASIEVAQDAQHGAGGDGALGSVVVRVLDSRANLTDAVLLLESEEALFQGPVRIERGVYRASFEMRPGVRRGTGLVTARVGDLAATISLSVAPAAAAVVRVTPPGPIPSDRASRAQFEVVVTDAGGNPAPEVPVGTGGRGTFGEAFPIEPGRWVLPYRSPRVLSDTTERVVVTAGSASTELDLEIVADRAPVSLGLKGGVALSGGRLAVAAGGELAVWALIGDAQLGLVLGVDWWMLSQGTTVTVGGVDTRLDATQSYVPVLLSLAWRVPVGGSWLVWATAGGGGAWVQNQTQLGAQPKVLESGFAPAASGSLSVGPHLGPGAAFLEVRGTWVGDARLSTLSGSSFTILGLLGFRFDVG